MRAPAIRWIAVIGVLAVGLAAWEVTHRATDAERRAFEMHVDEVAGLNLAQTLAALYPDRGSTDLRRALQAGECANRLATPGPAPTPCERFRDRDTADLTRRYFERAFAAGTKHEEKLHYYYVWFLIREGAPRAAIERARDEWRRSFPLSRAPDPLAAP